jgi:hypothetical protein
VLGSGGGNFFMFADTKLEKRGGKEKRRRKGRDIGGETSKTNVNWNPGRKMDNTLIAILWYKQTRQLP